MNAKNVRPFELKLGKRALIIFVLGMSCLLFVAFLLGIMVGKIMDAYPEKVARGIPHVIMECLGWSSKKAETDVAVTEAPKKIIAEDQEKMDLTFYDTLAKKKKNEKMPEKKIPVTPAAPPSKETPANLSPAKGKYQIQVVSLKEREKADQLCKKLIKLGYSPRVATAELQDRGKWFRVVLDGFESREQAQKVTNIISKKINGVNCVIQKKNNG
jgi:cell division protein FtsN